jgi:hypothetical protein
MSRYIRFTKLKHLIFPNGGSRLLPTKSLCILSGCHFLHVKQTAFPLIIKNAGNLRLICIETHRSVFLKQGLPTHFLWICFVYHHVIMQVDISTQESSSLLALPFYLECTCNSKMLDFDVLSYPIPPFWLIGLILAICYCRDQRIAILLWC